MPIEISCTGCNRKLRVADKAAGRKVRCPQCETVLAVPGAKTPPASGDAPTRSPQSTTSRPSAAPSRPAQPVQQPAEQWYVQLADEQQFGPISKGEMNAWARDGRISADSQLLREGDEQWQWATDVYPQLAAPQPSQGIAVPVGSFQYGGSQDASNPYASPTAGNAPYEENAPARKTGAVTSVAVSNFVIGGLQLACGLVTTLFLVVGGAAMSAMINEAAKTSQNPDRQEAATAAMGIAGAVALGVILFMLLIATTFLLAGYGIVKRRQWGRILTLILGGLSGLLALVSLYSLAMGNWQSIIGTMIYGGYAAQVFAVLLNQRSAAEFR